MTSLLSAHAHHEETQSDKPQRDDHCGTAPTGPCWTASWRNFAITPVGSAGQRWPLLSMRCLVLRALTGDGPARKGSSAIATASGYFLWTESLPDGRTAAWTWQQSRTAFGSVSVPKSARSDRPGIGRPVVLRGMERSGPALDLELRCLA